MAAESPLPSPAPPGTPPHAAPASASARASISSGASTDRAAAASMGAVWAAFSRNPDSFGRRELRPLVRMGVPAELRREVWPRCARIHKFHQKGFYGFIAQSRFRKPTPALKVIELVRVC